MSQNDDWLRGPDRERDDFDDRERDEYYERRSRRKQGMSTGMKIFVILLCIFGGLMLLCCGVGVYFGLKIKDGMSDDPVVAAKVAQEIVTMEIPKGLEPRQSMVMDIPLIPKVKMVVYQGKTAETSLMLMEVDVPPDQLQQNQSQDIQQKFEKQGNQTERLKEKKVTFKDIEIRGQKVRFQFTTGTAEKTGAKTHQISGTFPGNKSTVILFMQYPDKAYTDEDIMKMLKSIK
ncbi:MAG: hypothetical protein Tsb009_36030 [Planctomycetaceae bacterium]